MLDGEICGDTGLDGIQSVLEARGRRWGYTTVQTYLNRLRAKGHVASEAGSAALAHVYRAASTRDDLLRDRLRDLADQLCEATGGPCSYVGRDMKTAHRGMNITETEWTATVEALSRALDKNQVAPPDRAAILALLGPMKKDIVGQ